MTARTITILPGPMGTLLASRGISTPAPGWSAHALDTHPEAVEQIHREYAAAGAHIHIANTFRTQPRVLRDRWRVLARRAVALARLGAPEQPVAGSIAPVEDCYRPDLSPPDSRTFHGDMARELAAAGCDLLLCETFPNTREGLVAAEEAVAIGLPAWLSFTAGLDGSLLSTQEVARAARDASRTGARAVLINCTGATLTLPYVEALAEGCVGTALRFGAYANAGSPEDGCGWDDPAGPRRYADLADRWVAAGATIVGSCCGTGPGHTAELAGRFASASGQ